MLLAARLELERRNRNPSEIIELNLDNSRASEIEGLTDDYINLESLSLIHVGLQSLKGFPRLTSLKKLDLSENNIAGGLEPLVVACPNLENLSLANNVIKEVESLRPLSALVHLTSLDVFNCPVAGKETFREEVFEMLPNLKYLDGFDIDNQEESELDDEYFEEDVSDEEDGEEELDDEEDEVREEHTDEVEEYTNQQYDDEEEEEEEERVTNSHEEVVYNSNNGHSHTTPRASGKVGMTNNNTFGSEEEEEEDGDDEEGVEEDANELDNYGVDEGDDVDDVEEEDLSQLSEGDYRGMKRKYPLSSEEEITNDSYVINE